ncbi:MAG: DEAD/DEAH box helicase family protein, partial [Anaerolineae bacterium]
MDYQAFVRGKMVTAPRAGFEVEPGAVNPALKPFQREIVRWAVRGGRRALFESFGLGKTIQQLEIARIIVSRTGGRGLIVCPLGVRQEFARDAVDILGWPAPPRFIRRIEDVGEPQAPLPPGVRDPAAGTGAIYLTNYETVRDGKLDPRGFAVVSLDEAGVLRGLGGTKTFREMMRLYEGTAGYRFVATATPDPNEYIELLAYAAFLDVMDVGQAKTRFFKRDSTKADKLTIHPHKEEEFWLWVSSWAVFLSKPSDLGPEHSDDGYVLPPMTVHWHEVASDHSQAGARGDGQGRLFLSASHGVSEAAREKRDSLPDRVAKLMELRALDPDAHRIIWHDLEAERHAIERAIPDVLSVFGAQDQEEREAAIIGFSDGAVAELASKPVMLGQGCNFQRHCAWAIFLGVGFKFNDFIQSVHRIQRFLQARPVRIDLIYTEAEQSIRKVLE